MIAWDRRDFLWHNEPCALCKHRNLTSSVKGTHNDVMRGRPTLRLAPVEDKRGSVTGLKEIKGN